MLCGYTHRSFQQLERVRVDTAAVRAIVMDGKRKCGDVSTNNRAVRHHLQRGENGDPTPRVPLTVYRLS